MTTNTSTFRLALIGAGGIAGAHAGAARASEGTATVAAVVDINQDAAAKVAADHDAVAFRAIGELFSAIDAGDVSIDGIVICTPPSVRREPIESALSRKIAILVEKPLAANAEEAAALTELARAHPDVVTAVAFCHRFTPSMVEAKRQIAAGKIGRLTRFENVFAFHHPPMQDRWFSDPAIAGGGSFIDTGCHSLDLFHYLVGAPKVVGSVFDFDWPGRGESSASVLVNASAGDHSGVAGVILAGWLEPERFEVRLVGTAGELTYDFAKPTTLGFRAADGTRDDISVETHEVRFSKQLTAFVRAARSPADGTARGDLATFEDGLIASEAIDAAQTTRNIL